MSQAPIYDTVLRDLVKLSLSGRSALPGSSVGRSYRDRRSDRGRHRRHEVGADGTVGHGVSPG